MYEGLGRLDRTHAFDRGRCHINPVERGKLRHEVFCERATLLTVSEIAETILPFH